VLPRDHPLAGERELGMRQLAGEQFIGYREGARLRELLESAGRDAGFVPDVKLASNAGERIRGLVVCGAGIAIMPRSEAERPDRDFAVVTLVEPGLSRDITLAWRAGRRLAPAAVEFLERARSAFASQQPRPPGSAQDARRSRA